MAVYKKQLHDKDGNTIYPDVGIDLDNVVYGDDPNEVPDMSSLGGITIRSLDGSNTQTISSGSETVVKFPVSESSSGVISYNSSTGLFTVSRSGLYFIATEIGGTAGPLTSEVFVRGGEYFSNRGLVTGGVAYVAVSCMAYLNAGDTFQIKCYQTSGSNLVINSRAKGNMMACLVAPA